MDEQAAQQAESAPATEPQDFLSFKAAKVAAKSATSVEAQPPAEEKAAPESEPDTKEQELPKDKTAERKRANDEKREKRWYQERGEMKAELEATRRRLADAEAKLKAPREEAPAIQDGRPQLQAFLDSGKFKTYEEAQEAYQDARDEWRDQQREAKESAKSFQAKEKTVRTAFDADRSEFSKTHEDFDEAFESVTEALEANGRGNPVTDAVMRSKNPSALIDHLAKSDALTELSRLTQEGEYVEALVMLGEIRSKLASKPLKEAPVKEETTRVPHTVRARGHVPSTAEALKEAGDSGDFRKFKAAKEAAKNSGARF